jgi:dTDP-4-amino-4,6-dideoxygalactose transaminase
MIVPMSDLAAEYHALRTEIDKAISRVIESGSFVLGEEVEKFEVEFAAYCGSDYAVGVGSGTAAIHLALLACGVGRGDEVITVPNTDIPTTSAVSHCGASIVWVDVDPHTFNMDPSKIEGKITERTKAIMPVDLFGHPAEIDPIVTIGEDYGVPIVDDAALAVGAEYKGRKLGSLGDVTCFSLAPTKILGAYGDAGIVTTNSGRIADEIRVLSNYGHDLGMDDSQEGSGGFRYWRFVAEGYNERLDELQAAILRAKLPTLDERIERRRWVAQKYDALLGELDLVTPYEASHVRHVYRAYAVLVDDRDRVREHLSSKGVATHIYYIPPLHLQPVYQDLGFGLGDFAVAEEVASRTLCLPIFPEMTVEQIEYVVMALDECTANCSESTTCEEKNNDH